MHNAKLIPSGFEGKLAKIVIQGPQDRRPFTYYGIALREDEKNIYIRMGQTEIFFRKEFVDFIGFPKSDTVRQRKECKIVYQLGKFEKTQCAIGPFTETKDYVYIELDNGQKRMIPRDCILRMSYPGDKSKSGRADWTDKIHKNRKANGFSYKKWWSREHVEEVE